MSGIVGHTMYAILAGKAALDRKLPIATLIHRHYASYLCGSYLGCDIQTMPEAVCVDTGQEVGYGTAPLTKSPLTGGEVRPWSLDHDGQFYRPRDIHRAFYGRSHLVFGWPPADKQHTVPWDHLADYCAAVVEDASDLYGAQPRQLAYLLGWMTHVVGDSLIKSIQPGVELDLVDGKYTAKNRPIQDLVTFHEIGIKQLGLEWSAVLRAVASAPVEPIQLHYMRVGLPRGSLAVDFPNAWAPELQPLLQAVLRENRRYQSIRIPRLLKRYALKQVGGHWECDAELSRIAGGLSYREMLVLSKEARFPDALNQMAGAIVSLFEQVIQRSASLQSLPVDSSATWSGLTRPWQLQGRSP